MKKKETKGNMGTAEAGGQDGFGSFEGAQEGGGGLWRRWTSGGLKGRSKAVSAFFPLEQAKVVET